jgi:hypothetical protein
MTEKCKLVEDSFAAQTENLRQAAPSSVDNHKDDNVKPIAMPNKAIRPD